MNKKKLYNILNITFVAAVFIGLFCYMFSVDGVDNIIQVLKRVDYTWLLAGLVLTILYWLLEGMCFHVVTKPLYKRQPFRNCFRLAMIGRLFNNITPFSCGDQPAQLIAMKQEGKSISNGASILLTRFIAYQIVLVVYTMVVMFFQYNYFESLVSNFIYLAVIGFAINLIVVIFLIALAINEKFVYRLLSFFIIVLGKMRIIKKVDATLEKLKTTISDFQEQFEIMKKEKMMIVKLIIYNIVEITVLYSITYVVYRAFGQNTMDYFKILSAQALLALIIVYMPTPGAGIAAEGSFYIIFSSFFAANEINMAILFWRLYTFYLPIIVGVFFLLQKPVKVTDEEREEIVKKKDIPLEIE